MKNILTHKAPLGIRTWEFGNKAIRFLVLLFHISYLISTPQANAQSCATSTTPSVMAKWNFNSDAAQCNGAIASGSSNKITPILDQNRNRFCPTINAGCAKALLGSVGHRNTPGFNNAICLWNFYDKLATLRVGGSNTYDPTSTVWNPKEPANIYVTYELPVGKAGCLSSFALKILQKQYQGVVNFEKQGVAVYRDGVQIYSTTQNITPANINATPMTFTFPTTSEFCSDGSKIVKFEIIFGLVHQLVVGGWGTPGMTGYDDICVNGTCGGKTPPTATATPTTCLSVGGANADGKITLSGFAATDKYAYNMGSSYTGSATYATATAIPGGGVIASTLPNPATPQVYTVRVFSADCYNDVQVTLNPASCPGGCNQPTAATLTASQATCTGTTANNDASVAVTAVTGGDKVAISAGASYTGAATYATANALASGAYSFTGLANPTGSQVYTVRIYNASNTCYIDKTVTLDEKSCSPCANATVELVDTDALDPDSSPANSITTEDDQASYQLCKGTQLIDLKLTKTVSPASGTTCNPSTDFTWTLTLQNEGTMAATDIQVADILPNGLIFVSSTPSVGTFGTGTGWLISTLGAGATATLQIVTKASKAGTFVNVAEVQTAFPLNDVDSTPGNSVTTEDDYATASITVTGSSTPQISKEFSPMLTKPNVATRLTIKINNQSTTPITLTSDFVDTFPSTPAQMVVATAPNVSSSGMIIAAAGITATAGGTGITLPKGTVLQPGLNQISVDITVPSNGDYCNTIAIGDLKTNACDNIEAAEACLSANSTFDMAPIVKKSMSPATIQTGQTALLTITIENKNATGMTLNQDFVDYLPTGLLASGAVTSSCGGASLQNGNAEIKIAGGTVIAGNTTCTITVNVTSSTAGTYCNVIPMNAVLTTVGTNTNLGNEDIAEACVKVTASACTTLSSAAITPSPVSPVLPSAAVTLTGSATTTNSSSVFQWNSAAGTFSNVGINPTIWTAPATAGTYTVSLTINNNLTGYGTCTATASTTVVVAVPAVACTVITAATATATPSSFATGATSTLNVTGTGITAGTTTFAWAGTGGFTATTQNPSTGALATAGGYSYTVTATNANGTGTCTATATTSLTVSTATFPCTAITAITAMATPSSFATGGTATLDVTPTAAGTPSFSYAWSGTGGFTSAVKNPSTGALATAGGYSYTVTVTNANGTGICTATATTSLTVSTACTLPSFVGAAVQVTCTGTTPNADGKLIISGVTNADKVAYSTGATYSGTVTYTTATLISALSPAGQVVGTLSNPVSSQQYTIRVYNASNTCYTDQTVTLTNKNCVTPCGTPRCGTITITVNN